MFAEKNSTRLARGKRGNSPKRNSNRNWLSVMRAVETATAFKLGIACVDLDSVLLQHNFEDGIFHLGPVLPLGRKLVDLLRWKGYEVVVLTSRPVEQHQKIWQHLFDRNVHVDEVTNIKPSADCYLDDKAIRVPKNWE